MIGKKAVVMGLTQPASKNLYRCLVTWSLVIALLLTTFIQTGQARDEGGAVSQDAQQAQDAATATILYLPIIYRQYPYPSIFGAESAEISTYKLQSMREAGAYFARTSPFSWEAIEPVRTSPPTYHWETVDETIVGGANSLGLKMIATVKFTPAWAQKVPGVYCGPVAQEALDEFAEFMRALVTRYSGPSYGVKYWEIGNEVDIDATLVSPHNMYGCWGDQNEKYYGGEYYAQMLKAVYPAIKAADPQAQVLIGGLLLDCDPTNPPADKDCKSSKFLEGILVGGGASYFDIVSFHAFGFYTQGRIYEEVPTWYPRGGVVMGKINFLRQVMTEYGVDKPIMLTEASLLCPIEQAECNPIGDAFKDAQADYVVRLFTRSWGANLLGTIWYTMDTPGWRNSGLIGRPAYVTYQFLSSKLRGSTLVRPLTQYTGVTGYEFWGDGRYTWVLWATDNTSHSISLPANFLRAYDKYGNQITPTGNQITVNGAVILELTP
jgi:hypothetical protein